MCSCQSEKIGWRLFLSARSGLLCKRPVRVTINSLEQGHSHKRTKNLTRITRRSQHAIDFFHFKNQTKQLNRTFLGSILFHLLPLRKLPRPAANSTSPPILSWSCASQVSIPAAPRVASEWVNPTVNSQLPSHWTCDRLWTTLCSLKHWPHLASRTHTVLVFILSLAIHSQSAFLVSTHRLTALRWGKPGPGPQFLTW